MFSNLASYIFGSSSSEEATSNDPAAEAVKATPKVEDDWVVVGGAGQPQLTLGSMSEGAPRPVTGSTGSSNAPSEDDIEEEMVIVDNEEEVVPPPPRDVVSLTRSARRLTNPIAQANGLTLSQVKALRSSQKAKSKEAGKQMTAKATERHNKAVKIRSYHQSAGKKANLAIRSAGVNKHLKQC